MDDYVTIFDTTLRDGEQCPGAAMTPDQKLEVARQLAALRVDVIEAGFAAASPGDFEGVHRIATEIQGPTICSLSRARRSDIDRAAEALAPASRKRLHTFISTSPIHMKYKLQMQPHEVLEAIDDSVRYACGLLEDVEWSCEDGTRSDPEFLFRCFETAIKAGAKTVNIADTVGYIFPDEFGELVRSIRENVDGCDKAVFSVHCHDDLGLATANSMAAIRAGARQVECTVNGIGERAGNAALEEIVMAIRTRADRAGVATRVKTEELSRTSKLVSRSTGFVVPPNKPVVGTNAFAHESGIHQHGVIMHKQTYEIMTPESVGAAESKIVMGKHSGRHGLRKRLEDLGFGDLSDTDINDIFSRFKLLADERKGLTDHEIQSLVERRNNVGQHLQLDSLRLETLSDGRCSAKIVVAQDGTAMESSGEGESWWDATRAAIANLFPAMNDLSSIGLENAGDGQASSFHAIIGLEDANAGTAHAADGDPIMALAKASLKALESTLAVSMPGETAETLEDTSA